MFTPPPSGKGKYFPAAPLGFNVKTMKKPSQHKLLLVRFPRGSQADFLSKRNSIKCRCPDRHNGAEFQPKILPFDFVSFFFFSRLVSLSRFSNKQCRDFFNFPPKKKFSGMSCRQATCWLPLCFQKKNIPPTRSSLGSMKNSHSAAFISSGLHLIHIPYIVSRSLNHRPIKPVKSRRVNNTTNQLIKTTFESISSFPAFFKSSNSVGSPVRFLRIFFWVPSPEIFPDPSPL
jgi:hypothetical protein